MAEDSYQTWQNAVPYLQDLATEHRNIKNCIRAGDYVGALDSAELLITDLEPNFPRDSNDINSTSEEYETVTKMIRGARKTIELAERTRKTTNDKANYNNQLKDARNECLHICRILGNLMMKHELIFRQGVSIEDIPWNG